MLKLSALYRSRRYWSCHFRGCTYWKLQLSDLQIPELFISELRKICTYRYRRCRYEPLSARGKKNKTKNSLGGKHTTYGEIAFFNTTVFPSTSRRFSYGATYSNQNQIWCEKPRGIHGFWVHGGFWLLWPRVIVLYWSWTSVARNH